MKNRRRYFLKGILAHLYQRTSDGYLLFYSDIDYLVYFTIMCTVAPRYEVQILSFCQMPDHTHSAVVAQRLRDLSSFMRDTSMWFSRYGQAPQMKRGKLFNKEHYGSAVKTGDKKARTNLIYIGNNPVERHLTDKAEDYKWNYLAYANSDHPFSEEVIIRHSSSPMKNAMAEIRDTHSRDTPLSYCQIKRFFSKLNKEERLQLMDYIITTYSVIDYDATIRYFGSYEKMVGAMHYNTGAEYDINELFVGRSDLCYAEISSWILRNLKIKDVHDVFLMEDNERADLLLGIHRALGIDPHQIAKYLRLKIESEKR